MFGAISPFEQSNKSIYRSGERDMKNILLGLTLGFFGLSSLHSSNALAACGDAGGGNTDNQFGTSMKVAAWDMFGTDCDEYVLAPADLDEDLEKSYTATMTSTAVYPLPIGNVTGSSTAYGLFSIPGFGFVINSESEQSSAVATTLGKTDGAIEETVYFSSLLPMSSFSGAFEVCGNFSSALPATSSNANVLGLIINATSAEVILDFNPASGDFVIDIPVLPSTTLRPLATVKFTPSALGEQCATGGFTVSNVDPGTGVPFRLELVGSGSTNVVNTFDGSGVAHGNFEGHFKFTSVSAGVSCSALSGTASACGDLGVLAPVTLINPLKCKKGCETSVGNPINFSLGFKHQTETDYAGGVLSLTRSYRSDADWYSHNVGQLWRHNYDRSVVVSGDLATLTNEAGLVHTFENDDIGNWLPIADDNDVTATLVSTAAGYLHTTANDTREYYDTSGRLMRVEYRAGEALNFLYDASLRLSSVSDESGQSLTFGYDGSGRISTLVTPDGTFGYGYDGNGNLTTVTKPDTKTRIYHYEDATYLNALTGITNETGVRYATYGYDAEGRAVSSEHAGGVDSYTITYNPDDSVTTTNPLGKQTTYHFETILGVRKIVSVEGHQSTNCAAANKAYTYDVRGFVESKTDWKGNITTYVRDDRGLIASKTEALGTTAERTIGTTYDPLFRLPDVITEAGKTTDYDYDVHGRTTSETITDTVTGKARITTYGYHPDSVDAFGNPILGRLASIDGSRTDVSDLTSFEYDANYRLIKTTNALGHVSETLAFDVADRPILVRDANGVETSMVYDTSGRLSTSTQGYGMPSAATTIYGYDDNGSATSVTQSNGVVIYYDYDDAQRLTGVTDSLGNSMTYILDNAGNRTAEEYRDTGSTLRYANSNVFDELSRLIENVGANGDVSSHQYDVNGNLTETIDGNLNPTTYAFDGLDRLVSSIDALNGQTVNSINHLDQTESVTDPRFNSTSYSYNAFGDLVQEISPDRGTVNYTHDAGGNALTRTDAGGEVVSYIYDALNRITSISYSGDAGLNSSYIYDAIDGCGYSVGRLCSIVGGEDTASALDGICAVLDQNSGRLAKRLCSSFQADGATASFYKSLDRTCKGMDRQFQRKGKLSARYDGMPPLCEARQSAAQSTNYIYDELGRLTNVTEIRGTLNLTTAYTYDSAGTLSSITYPSGRVISYVLNANGQVVAVDDGATNLASSITYLPFGGIENLTYGNGIALTNIFNTSYQLTSRQIGSLFYDTYEYDGVGNITVKGATSYIFDPLYRLTDEDSSAGLFNYSYDAIGNRLTESKNGVFETYIYPSDSSRLSDIGAAPIITDVAGNITTDAQRSYTINAAGQVQEVSISGAVVGSYVYDANNQRTSKTVNGITTHYVYGAGGLLYGEYDSTGNFIREYVYLNGEPLAQINAGEALLYLHTDHLGTPRVASDNTATQVWNWQSDAFGNGTPTGSATINLRFAGQYYDDESGLHYNWNRYYDPATGRYITSDPIGLDGGLNTYAYVSANPVMFVDPEGLTWEQINQMHVLASKLEKDLNVPPLIVIAPLGYNGKDKVTGFTPLGLLFIDSLYLNELSCYWLHNLYETIIHETLHMWYNWGVAGVTHSHTEFDLEASKRMSAASGEIKKRCVCTG
jgi:RHS repeat-associated protein